MPKTYVDEFVRRGKVLFRSLSYFHDLESKDGRADAYEGTRRYQPHGGLEITNTRSGEQFNLPETFSLESTARTSEIFVFCASTLLNPALADEFQSDTCIEILDEVKLISRIRAALLLRARVRPPKTLLHGPVTYYDSAEPPIIDWALPDRITMSKSNRFRGQSEYRIAFAVNDAFRVQDTSQVLTTRERAPLVRERLYPQDTLVLGDLRRIVHVHRFKSATV